MSRILCVWELGEDLNHIATFSQITSELLSVATEVFFVAKDLSRIETFTWDPKVKVLQAPIWGARSKAPQITNCFADILLNKAYQSPATLRPLVRAWLELFELLKPDLLLFDHSPTALLAARALSIPKVIISNCFVTPPYGTDPTNLRPWDSTNSDAIAHNDARVVSIINDVATTFALPAITKVSDLYKVDHFLTYTFKALDPYQDARRDVRYLGPLSAPTLGQKTLWHLSSVKVFAYLKFGYENTEVVIDALIKSGANLVCFYAGASLDYCRNHSTAQVFFSNQPFDLDDAIGGADVILCHAGIGMVSCALKAAKPLILLPTQLEQKHTAICVDKMRLGISINKGDSAELIADKMNHFFTNPDYRENVRRFSFENNNAKFIDGMDVIVDLCKKLLVQ